MSFPLLRSVRLNAFDLKYKTLTTFCYLYMHRYAFTTNSKRHDTRRSENWKSDMAVNVSVGARRTWAQCLKVLKIIVEEINVY